jgi:hypothetical protein
MLAAIGACRRRPPHAKNLKFSLHSEAAEPNSADSISIAIEWILPQTTAISVVRIAQFYSSIFMTNPSKKMR